MVARGRGTDVSLIKRAHVKTPYTDEQFSQLIECYKDPIYFIENFIWVVPKNGKRALFQLFDYQKEIVHIIHECNDSILLCPRQSGKTTTTGGYLLWHAMFIPDSTILVCAHVQKQALEIMQRIRFSYEEVPDFIRAGVVGYNKGSIEFDNGSRIIATATTPTTGRGMTINVLYLDEMAHIQPQIATQLWASIRPTLSPESKCIITSTPNNDEDQFSQIWKEATRTLDDYGNPYPNKCGRNGFRALKVDWREVPGYDEEWAKHQISNIGLAKFRREFECTFVPSEETLIESQILADLEGRDEKFKLGDSEIRFYEHPQPNRTYLVGLDPAVGTGGDIAAIVVYQLPEMIQVAEWSHNQTPVLGQIRNLLSILRYIDHTLRTHKNQKGVPEIYWTIENNGMGEHAVSVIDETGEEFFPGVFMHEPKRSGRRPRLRKGLITSQRTKLSACSKLKNLIESDRIGIFSRALVRELKFYVRQGEGFQPKWGENDGLIAATLLCIRMTQIMQNWDDSIMDNLRDDADADYNDETEYVPLPPSVLRY